MDGINNVIPRVEDILFHLSINFKLFNNFKIFRFSMKIAITKLYAIITDCTLI